MWENIWLKMGTESTRKGAHFGIISLRSYCVIGCFLFFCNLLRYWLISVKKVLSSELCFSVMNGVNRRRGHTFSTYAQRREGAKQKRTLCVQRGGGLNMEVRTKKCLFLHVFCNSFICWKLLPYFVVFGVDFHYCLIKHLL